MKINAKIVDYWLCLKAGENVTTLPGTKLGVCSSCDAFIYYDSRLSSPGVQAAKKICIECMVKLIPDKDKKAKLEELKSQLQESRTGHKRYES